jgi:hypothetical protein
MITRKWKLEKRIAAALKQAAAEHRLDVADHLLQALETLNAGRPVHSNGVRLLVH